MVRHRRERGYANAGFAIFEERPQLDAQSLARDPFDVPERLDAHDRVRAPRGLCDCLARGRRLDRCQQTHERETELEIRFCKQLADLELAAGAVTGQVLHQHVAQLLVRHRPKLAEHHLEVRRVAISEDHPETLREDVALRTRVLGSREDAREHLLRNDRARDDRSNLLALLGRHQASHLATQGADHVDRQLRILLRQTIDGEAQRCRHRCRPVA